jgi:hypothetical protein
LFAALIGTAIIDNVLQSAGVARLSGRAGLVAMFGFFRALRRLWIFRHPVMVKTVVAAQPRDGPVARALAPHQNAIIYAMWGVMGAGCAIAIPAAVIGGMFGNVSRQMVQRAREGSSMGTLSAAPGMSLDEMTRHLDAPSRSQVCADGDRRQRSLRIHRAQFSYPVPHFITTRDDDQTKINVVTSAPSPEKGSKPSYAVQSGHLSFKHSPSIAAARHCSPYSNRSIARRLMSWRCTSLGS